MSTAVTSHCVRGLCIPVKLRRVAIRSGQPGQAGLCSPLARVNLRGYVVMPGFHSFQPRFDEAVAAVADEVDERRDPHLEGGLFPAVEMERADGQAEGTVGVGVDGSAAGGEPASVDLSPTASSPSDRSPTTSHCRSAPSAPQGRGFRSRAVIGDCLAIAGASIHHDRALGPWPWVGRL